ncbi:hypothetical protein, partial [Salmonella sp. s51944]|uniref:hypothetical protein n=1 Tax=Salmonella sp. s51944 TaxID=3159655 RepID=UPI0039802EED
LRVVSGPEYKTEELCHAMLTMEEKIVCNIHQSVIQLCLSRQYKEMSTSCSLLFSNVKQSWQPKGSE